MLSEHRAVMKFALEYSLAEVPIKAYGDGRGRGLDDSPWGYKLERLLGFQETVDIAKPLLLRSAEEEMEISNPWSNPGWRALQSRAGLRALLGNISLTDDHFLTAEDLDSDY